MAEMKNWKKRLELHGKYIESKSDQNYSWWLESYIIKQAASIAELEAAAKLFIASFPLPPYHNDSSGKRGFGKDSPIVLAYKATEIALKTTADKRETEEK